MVEDNALELDIPEPALTADRAVEVLRAWIADGALVVALEAGAFEDGADDWGRLLSEVAHHVARAQAHNGTMSEGEALQVIKEAFDRTYPMIGDHRSGEIVRRKQH
jgi:hypothetical protein